MWWHRLTVAALCLVLVLLGMFLSESAEPAPPPEPTQKWVHGSHGWQLALWEHDVPTYTPALHPAVLAAFLAMASLTALLAFSPVAAEEPVPRDRKDSP